MTRKEGERGKEDDEDGGWRCNGVGEGRSGRRKRDDERGGGGIESREDDNEEGGREEGRWWEVGGKGEIQGP
jgi:hypothetical protein